MVNITKNRLKGTANFHGLRFNIPASSMTKISLFGKNRELITLRKYLVQIQFPIYAQNADQLSE